jgi:hypothetical protein
MISSEMQYLQNHRVKMKPLQRAVFAFEQKRRDVCLAAMLSRTFLFGFVGLTSILAAGCATISPAQRPAASQRQPDRARRIS